MSTWADVGLVVLVLNAFVFGVAWIAEQLVETVRCLIRHQPRRPRRWR